MATGIAGRLRGLLGRRPSESEDAPVLVPEQDGVIVLPDAAPLAADAPTAPAALRPVEQRRAPGVEATGAAAGKAPAARSRAKAPAAKAPAAKAPAAKAPVRKAAAKKAPTAAKAPAAGKAATAKAPAAKAAPTKAAAAKAPASEAADTRAPAASKAPASRAARAKPPAAKRTPATPTAPAVAPAVPAVAPPATAAPAEEGWTRAELAALREELQVQAATLRREVDDVESAVEERERRAAGEGSGDEADAGSKAFEREHELSLANNSRDLLLQVERALSRIDAGTYGRCERCESPIPKPRLQAFPRMTLCVSCKTREERR